VPFVKLHSTTVLRIVLEDGLAIFAFPRNIYISNSLLSKGKVRPAMCNLLTVAIQHGDYFFAKNTSVTRLIGLTLDPPLKLNALALKLQKISIL
jgi:hypothetical protein